MPPSEEDRETGMRFGLDGNDADALAFASDEVRIGSGQGNHIVLPPDDAAPLHLLLQRRLHGWWLRVEPGAERVHVNARPVRELALLRPGDVISVGRRKLVLLPQASKVEPPLAVGPGGDPRGRAGLRCVSGPLSGRLLVLDPDLQLDRLTLPGVTGCLRVHALRGAANFELIHEGDAVAPGCNGLRAERGLLHDGDQLAWGRHRFVLECSGPLETVSPDAHAGAGQATPAGSAQGTTGRDLMWLLAVAVMLAGGIAVLLVLRG